MVRLCFGAVQICCFHAASPNQEKFLRLYSEKVVPKLRAASDFVLSRYVSSGVGELDQEKLIPLLCLKCHTSIADAVADLGKPKK